MNQPNTAGRSMLSALLASQSNTSHIPDTNKIDSTSNNNTLDSTQSRMKSEQDSAETASPSSLEVTPDTDSKVYDRTTKVAKTGYSDHGAHAVVVDEESESSGDVLSECDEELTATNPSQWPQESRHRLTPKKRASPGFGLRHASSSNEASQLKGKPTSLLHAALQQGGIAASLSAQDVPPVRGECLTNPSDPISNDGADNTEGNLIVHEHDLLKIPTRKVHNHSADTKSFLNNNDPLGVTTFQVMGLLGQGTFAQVFKCKNLDTGKICAVKIVKNKPAYTRQATMEIDVFKTMMKESADGDPHERGSESKETRNLKDYMVSLLCYFMYKSHLCLVFELLGQNLYELLKRRQFRGLSVGIVRDLMKQATTGVTELSQRKIVHCDLKPENILVVSDEVTQAMVDSNEGGKSKESDKGLRKGNSIKLIDFGSACFEGSSGFTYIQSRFYRSPEVLVGVNYDSAIDMWSLGCVAAELFLGLPILPGVHELDQLGRIQEMIGDMPEWMLDQG